MKRLLISIVVLLFGTMAAQASGGSSCLERQVVITASDAGGRPLPDLSPQQLRGEVAGKPVAVTETLAVGGVRRVLLLLERNRSMQEAWPMVLGVVANTVASAPSDVSLAMLAYSQSRPDTVAFSTNSRNEIAERLMQYSKTEELPNVKGALLATIDAGVNLLQPSQEGDAIVLVTNFAMEEDVAKARQELIRHGVRLYLVVMGADPTPRTEVERASLMLLQRLADETGGASLVEFRPRLSPEPQVVREASIFIASAIQNRAYRLNVRLPHPVEKWRGWKLNAVDANGKTNPRIVLRYPHLLVPCTAEGKN